MEENDVETLNNNKYSDSCRVCLKSKSNLKEMLNSFYDGNQYLEIYKSTCISDREIFESIGNLTTQLCSDCETKLLLFYDFRKNCNSSETTLAIYLSKFNKVEVEEDEVKYLVHEDDMEEQEEVLFEEIEVLEEENCENLVAKTEPEEDNTLDPNMDYCEQHEIEKNFDPKDTIPATAHRLSPIPTHKVVYRDWKLKKKLEENPDTVRRHHSEHSVEFQSNRNKIKQNGPEHHSNAVTCDICGLTLLKKCFLKHTRIYHPNHAPNVKGTEAKILKSARSNRIVLIPKPANWDTEILISCMFCSKTYTKSIIHSHYNTVHHHELKNKCEKDESSVSCERCSQNFKCRSLLITHCKKSHKELYQFVAVRTKEIVEVQGKNVVQSNNEKQIKNKVLCQICGEYKTAEHLYSHEEIVGADTVFPCDVCGDVFKKKYTRDGHRKRHFIENYPCRHCEQIFKSWLSRRNHEDLVHTKINRFPCNFCEQTFLTSQRKIMHTRRYHTGEKPYACTFCEKRFYSSNHLKDHLETHVQTQTYECKFCDKKYNRKRSLAQHIRLNHKAERDSLKNPSNI